MYCDEICYNIFIANKYIDLLYKGIQYIAID